MQFSKNKAIIKGLVKIGLVLSLSVQASCDSGGISGKQESLNESGESILRVWMELRGSLFGAYFPEGGIELYAVGDGDETKRNKIANFAGTVYIYNSRSSYEAASVVSFELPFGSTSWTLEKDYLAGLSCQFDPTSGNLADLPTKLPENPSPSADDSEGQTLRLQDDRFFVTATCEDERLVAGSVTGHKGDIKLMINDAESITISPGAEDSADFQISTTAFVPSTSRQVDNELTGRASRYWSLWGVRSSTAEKKFYKLAIAEVPNGQTCQFETKVEADGDTDMEKTVLLEQRAIDLELTAGDNVDVQPQYREIMNPNLNIICEGEPEPRTPPATFTLSVNVSGLSSGTLRLRNLINLNSLDVVADGTHSFSQVITENDGYDYDVRILAQPAGHTCTLTGDVGTATADVTVLASCALSDP